MSMHKRPLTALERSGLEKHGLDIGTPSQLSDCFRQGVAHGLAANVPKKWTEDEIAAGYTGVRWVSQYGVHGRPTEHDVREYLIRRGAEVQCNCDVCVAWRLTGSLPQYWRETIEQAIDALAYAAFNINGSKLENLSPGLIETTDVADTALIAERDLRALLKKTPK